MRLFLVTCFLGLISFIASAQVGNGLASQPAAVQHRSADENIAAAAVTAMRPGDVLLRARTVCIETKTDFFTPETLERSLLGEKDFAALGLVIVKDPRVADLIIQVDRPLFTHQRTFTVFDTRTTMVFLTGNVRAWDGTLASGPIARQIVAGLLKQRVEAVKPAGAAGGTS